MLFTDTCLKMVEIFLSQFVCPGLLQMLVGDHGCWVVRSVGHYQLNTKSRLLHLPPLEI